MDDKVSCFDNTVKGADITNAPQTPPPLRDFTTISVYPIVLVICTSVHSGGIFLKEGVIYADFLPGLTSLPTYLHTYLEP